MKTAMHPTARLTPLALALLLLAADVGLGRFPLRIEGVEGLGQTLLG